MNWKGVVWDVLRYSVAALVCIGAIFLAAQSLFEFAMDNILGWFLLTAGSVFAIVFAMIGLSITKNCAYKFESFRSSSWQPALVFAASLVVFAFFVAPSLNNAFNSFFGQTEYCISISEINAQYHTSVILPYEPYNQNFMSVVDCTNSSDKCRLNAVEMISPWWANLTGEEPHFKIYCTCSKTGKVI